VLVIAMLKLSFSYLCIHTRKWENLYSVYPIIYTHISDRVRVAICYLLVLHFDLFQLDKHTRGSFGREESI